MDLHRVIDMIPEDWEIKCDKKLEEYDLMLYLKNMFERVLTTEENKNIESHLSKMEVINVLKEFCELKQGYLVIDDQRL